MSGEAGQAQNPEQAALTEQVLRDLKAVKETVEAIRNASKEPRQAAEAVDLTVPVELDYANADTRALVETQLSSLTRVQKAYAEGESRSVALESFQRGLEEVPLDVRGLAERTETAWWVSDQKFGHLLRTKHGGVGHWLARHGRLLIVASVAAALGAVALVRFTDPAVLNDLAAHAATLTLTDQYIILAATGSVALVLIAYFWSRGRSRPPQTVGAVSQ